MTCHVERDDHGTTYTIPTAQVSRTPGGKVLRGVPELTVWWARRFKKDKADELLLLRQENNAKSADVIGLTFGQVYDLIDALNKAVETY